MENNEELTCTSKRKPNANEKTKPRQARGKLLHAKFTQGISKNVKRTPQDKFFTHKIEGVLPQHLCPMNCSKCNFETQLSEEAELTP